MAHIFGTEPGGGLKFSGYYFLTLNRLVHKFAAKFEDPHGAAFADSMVHWLLIQGFRKNTTWALPNEYFPSHLHFWLKKKHSPTQL